MSLITLRRSFFMTIGAYSVTGYHSEATWLDEFNTHVHFKAIPAFNKSKWTGYIPIVGIKSGIENINLGIRGRGSRFFKEEVTIFARITLVVRGIFEILG